MRATLLPRLRWCAVASLVIPLVLLALSYTGFFPWSPIRVEDLPR